MHPPYKSGALHFVRLEMDRERVCPRCKKDLRVRNYNELCDECKLDPIRLESVRLHNNRKQAKAARRRYHAKKVKQ